MKTGDFVWHELRTTDAKSATDFYTHVVGWKTMPSGDPGGMPYTLLAVNGMGVAGLMEMPEAMQQEGMKPSWAGFIGVDDVDGYAKRIESAGGSVDFGPADIPEVGRFASVRDPQGASFLLLKGNRDGEPPRPSIDTPGTVGWNELSASDEQSAWQFYSDLFGWTVVNTMDMGPMGIYRMFKNGDGPGLGGMMNRDQKSSPVPYWLFYINVDNIDTAVARVREKQGQVVMGPHEVPGGQSIIIGIDPQGAHFALVSSPKS